MINIFILFFLLLLSSCGDWKHEENVSITRHEEPHTKIPEIKRVLRITGVTRSLDIKDLASYTDLYFEERAKLVTDGNPLNLILKEIESKDGSIETFLEDSATPDNFEGLSGNNIFIKAEKAVGHLSIILRGQNGGKRTDEPAPLGESGRGATGGKGHDAQVSCYERPPEGEGRHSRPHGQICHCSRHAGNGGRGGQGAKGKTGYKGLNGGDSGNINIEIGDSSKFEIDYDRIPGFGGEGSIGGLGGLGGHGGASGRAVHPCRDGSHGPQGEKGARGNKGEYGDSGLLGKICQKLSFSDAKYCF